MLQLHHPGFSCPLCRTFANLDEDVEVELETEPAADGESDSASAGDTGIRGPPAPPRVGLARTVVANDAMDVDGEGDAESVAGAVLAAAAQIAAGAETEVERDPIAGETLRNRGGNGGGRFRRRTSPPSTSAGGHILDEHGALVEEEVDDDFDVVAENGVEFDDAESVNVHAVRGRLHNENPLPPLPVPAPAGNNSNGVYTGRSASGSANGSLSASPSPPAPPYDPSSNLIGIARPMSAPLTIPQGSNAHVHANMNANMNNLNLHPAASAIMGMVDDFSDGEGDGGYVRDMEGSGSSGDGENGSIGAGGKRKR